MRIAKKYYTLGLGLNTKPTDESIRDTIIKDREEALDATSDRHKDREKEFKKAYIKDICIWLGSLFLLLLIPVGIFIYIDQYIKQKHIDSGTPYIRGITPNGYLIEQIKLKDGTTWDILCIDGVKTIYDIDKRLVSETNLACF